MKSLLGRKLGMTQIFSEAGRAIAVTVVELGPNVVMQRKTVENDGYSAVQLGFLDAKKASKPALGHAKKSGLEKDKKFMQEIRVPAELEIAEGLAITADQVFEIGEEISVTGTSIGKGTQGSIKRWGFTKGPQSHGSKNNRIAGSQGAFDRGGRIPKGRKKAGRMGMDQVTISGLKIVDILSVENVVLVSGAIPGPKNGWVVVSNRKTEYDAGKLANKKNSNEEVKEEAAA